MAMAVLITLLVLSLVIFVHELGHFWMARRAGIAVLEFSVGMGPKVISRKYGETLWCLRALPLGGFVKLAGLDEADEGTFPPEANFYAKPLSARAWTISAGSLMNLLSGFLLFVVLFTLMGVPRMTPVLEQVLPDSPAQTAGLLKGDRILSLNGRSIEDIEEDFIAVIRRSADQPVQLAYERGGETFQLAVTPRLKTPQSKAAMIGVGFESELIRYNPLKAVSAGFRVTLQYIALVFQSLYMLVSGQASLKDMAGPIGIVQFASFGLGQSVFNFINVIAMISISLAVINLFPFPVLDGGHLLFLAIEAVRGKPLSKKWETWIVNAGAAVLITLMVVVLVNDVVHWKARVQLLQQLSK